MGLILIKKSLGEGPISQKIAKKVEKSAVCEAEKPLQMGLNLRKKLSNQPFLSEKNP